MFPDEATRRAELQAMYERMDDGELASAAMSYGIPVFDTDTRATLRARLVDANLRSELEASSSDETVAARRKLIVNILQTNGA